MSMILLSSTGRNGIDKSQEVAKRPGPTIAFIRIDRRDIIQRHDFRGAKQNRCSGFSVKLDDLSAVLPNRPEAAAQSRHSPLAFRIASKFPHVAASSMKIIIRSVDRLERIILKKWR
jgi:hypothetical protein